MAIAPQETTAPAKQSLCLSLVVPIYNEEQTVSAFLETIEPVAREILQRFAQITQIEVVFVDDGSTDRSVERLLTHASDVLDLKIVKLSRNFRKDNALAAGLQQAGGNAVIPMDVDLQDPPDLLIRMIPPWLDGARIVNAKRASREKDSFLKRTTSRLFYEVINRLSDYPINPDVGDFRLLDRRVVDILNDMPERVRFTKGLFAWVGFSPVTVEYDRAERTEGESKWNYWKLWNFALDGITGSTTLPIRAWTYFGCLVAVLAIVYALFLVVRTAIFGVDVPGYASLMVITLFLGACNMIALGMMGEYVGRLTVETKRRPVFVIDEIIERHSTPPEVAKLPKTALQSKG